MRSRIVTRYPLSYTTPMRKLLFVLLLLAGATPTWAQPADEFPFTRAIVVNSPPDITSWPITAGITSVRFSPPVGWVVDFDRRLSGNPWPSVIYPGFTGPLQYTLGLCRKLTPSWVCSSVVEFWQHRIEEEGPHSASGPNEIAKEWFYDGRWGALAGWQPVPGEEVGVYIQACDGRNLAATPPGCTPQRTAARLVKWGVDVGPPVVVDPPHTDPPHTDPGQPQPTQPPNTTGLVTSEQAERMFANMTAQINALVVQLQAVDDRVKKHDEDPTVVRKFLSSPLGIAIMSIAGTYITTHQVLK